MTAAFRLEGGLQHSGSTLGMFSLLSSTSLVRLDAILVQGRKVWEGWGTLRRSLRFGRAVPTWCPSHSWVTLSCIKGLWEQQPTALLIKTSNSKSDI